MLKSKTFLGVCAGLAFIISGFCFAGAEDGEASGALNSGGYKNYPEGEKTSVSLFLGKPDRIPMNALLVDLLDAINFISKYKIPNFLPNVQFVPSEVVEAYACGKPCKALAVYRSGEGVYINEEMNPETNVFARSVLLHELVHFVQDINRELASVRDCERWYRREQEAYAIQKRFLEMIGSQIRVAYSAGDACPGE